MKLEPTLHKALLAGSARVPLTADALASPALQQVLAEVADDSKLWHTIAAADLWQRAGFEPGAASDSPASAAPDHAVAGRAAEQVLQLILRGIHPELLDNWLTLARNAHATVPHACLVPLIELARQKRALRNAVGALLGERGRWLVLQNPDWSEALDAGPAGHDSWELGSLAQRIAALQAMRAHDPCAALALLEADWAQEPPDNRSALLPCLLTGLGLADEAFLERALDDKRKEVRGVAQQLLSSLPGSQLQQRCKARLLALLTVERPATGPKLILQLPPDCDKAMKRDGIGLQTYHSIGVKAGWLQDMLGCVPPQFWCSHWDLAPRAVIDLFAADEFSSPLLDGLGQATARALDFHADPVAVDWFISLAGSDMSRAGIYAHDVLMSRLKRLAAVDQERLAASWLAEPPDNPYAFGYAMRWAEEFVGGSAAALSPQLSQIFLRKVQQAVLADPMLGPRARYWFKTLARIADAADVTYMGGGWPAPDWEHWPVYRPLFDEMMETLNFRHTMQASFLENDA